MLMDEINDLKSSLYNKDREIIDLSQKKEKIETALSEYKANSGKLKDYEKRIAKLGSEIVNTKSMYDALKGKN
jgi:predicted RNase H-like nuclease (RuvC/YqgF family)